MKIILIIKQIFKILFSKQFWKYIKDGLLYQPKRFAKHIEHKTDELNKYLEIRKKDKNDRRRKS